MSSTVNAEFYCKKFNEYSVLVYKTGRRSAVVGTAAAFDQRLVPRTGAGGRAREGAARRAGPASAAQASQ